MLAKILRSTAMLAALGVAVPAAADSETTVTLLHFNDFHSRIEPINRFNSTCSAEDDAAGECFGGAARMATAVAQLRAESENPVLISAGDLFQGSLMYTTYKGDVEIEMMNRLGLDVMAVGNHAFDDGPDNLDRVLEMAEFPVISGNMDLSMSEDLTGDIDDSVVLDLGGTRVGFVGSITTDTAEIASPGPDILFQDAIDAMQADVDDLIADGVDIVIAVTHLGYVLDQQLAASVSGLDAVVGGHSHSYLSSEDEDAEGPYPTMVEGADGVMVPVVQAGAYSKYLGQLALTFDDEGVLTGVEGAPVLLDASFEPDAEIAARVAELAGPVEEAMAVVVGEAAEAIEGDRSVCRAMECSMGNLVADAMLERVRAQGIDVAIQNGGGLRASIDGGPITMGEVFTVLPFQNTLATFQLTGAGILEALENGVSQVEEGGGRFPQVAGMRYVWNPAAEPGSRIVSVEIETADGFVPIDPAATYGVVSNNFMRAGGDGYSVFAVDAMNAYDYGPGLEEVVASYLTENAPYSPYTDGRVSAAE